MENIQLKQTGARSPLLTYIGLRTYITWFRALLAAIGLSESAQTQAIDRIVDNTAQVRQIDPADGSIVIEYQAKGDNNEH